MHRADGPPTDLPKGRTPSTVVPSGDALPDAVFWDMDGTLIDTEQYWIASEFALVAECGGTWTNADAHAVVGKDLRDTARYLQANGGVTMAVDDIVERLMDGVIAGLREAALFMPGAVELLTGLGRLGVPCALVTMSWRRLADEVVNLLPPGTFTVTIVGDEVSAGKPDPAPYLAAASALGVDPRRCVAIEDSPTGLRSAEAAGCNTLAVPNLLPLPNAPGRTIAASLVGVTPGWLGGLVSERL